MKKIKYIFILYTISVFCLLSCKKQNNTEENETTPTISEYTDWTQAEIDLIMSGDSTEPMRILLVTDLEDSLFLRKDCIPIKPDANDEVLKRLRQRMLVTMTQADGVGIAAPQVGIGRDVFWCQRFDLVDKPYQFIINPKIIFASVKMVKFPWDGCLSMPNYSGASTRHSSV